MWDAGGNVWMTGQLMNRITSKPAEGTHMNELEICRLVWQMVLVCDPLPLVPTLQLSCLAPIHMSLHQWLSVTPLGASDVSAWRL